MCAGWQKISGRYCIQSELWHIQHQDNWGRDDFTKERYCGDSSSVWRSKSISFRKENSVSDLIKKFEKEVAGRNDNKEMGLDWKWGSNVELISECKIKHWYSIWLVISLLYDVYPSRNDIFISFCLNYFFIKDLGKVYSQSLNSLINP